MNSTRTFKTQSYQISDVLWEMSQLHLCAHFQLDYLSAQSTHLIAKLQTNPESGSEHQLPLHIGYTLPESSLQDGISDEDDGQGHPQHSSRVPSCQPTAPSIGVSPSMSWSGARVNHVLNDKNQNMPKPNPVLNTPKPQIHWEDGGLGRTIQGLRPFLFQQRIKWF